MQIFLCELSHMYQVQNKNLYFIYRRKSNEHLFQQMPIPIKLNRLNKTGK